MTPVNFKKLLASLATPDPRLRGGMHVLLILALAYSLAQFTWRLFPAADLGELPPLEFVTKGNHSMQKSAGIEQQIPQWHLFGEVSVEVDNTPAPIDLPVTNLKLTLRGVIASPDPLVARAIIADPAGKENFYKIDEKLPGNAVLKEVYGDRIVIQRGSRFETLKLPKESLELSDTRPQTRSFSNGRQTATHISDVSRGGASLKELRETVLNNPERITDLVRISPQRRNGKFAGYQLQPGRDASLLARYGLMPGDVVTAVNGVELDSPTKGLGLLKDLSTADMLDLEIERNGARQRFTLPVQ